MHNLICIHVCSTCTPAQVTLLTQLSLHVSSEQCCIYNSPACNPNPPTSPLSLTLTSVLIRLAGRSATTATAAKEEEPTGEELPPPLMLSLLLSLLLFFP